MARQQAVIYAHNNRLMEGMADVSSGYVVGLSMG